MTNDNISNDTIHDGQVVDCHRRLQRHAGLKDLFFPRLFELREGGDYESYRGTDLRGVLVTDGSAWPVHFEVTRDATGHGKFSLFPRHLEGFKKLDGQVYFVVYPYASGEEARVMTLEAVERNFEQEPGVSYGLVKFTMDSISLFEFLEEW